MQQHKQGQTVHKQRRCTEIQPVDKRQQRNSEYIKDIKEIIQNYQFLLRIYISELEA